MVCLEFVFLSFSRIVTINVIPPDNPIVDAAEDEGGPGRGHEGPRVHPGVPQVSEDVFIEPIVTHT